MSGNELLGGTAAETGAEDGAGKEESGKESWYKDFGDGYDGLSKFQDPKNLADSYFSLEKMVGKDTMLVPNSEDPKAMGDVYDKLGRPKAHTDYSFGEGSKMEITEDFQKQAHELGLSSSQVENLGKWYEGFSASTTQGQADLVVAQAEKDREQLKKDWGNDFDRNSNVITRILEDIPDAELRQSVENKFSNDLDFVKFMKHISEKAYKEESGLITGGSDDSASIEDELKLLTTKAAYLDSKDPLHDSTVRKVRELYVKLENRR